MCPQVQEFLLESFAQGTEGLMLKRLDDGAAYQPSKRSESWIKIKRCDDECTLFFPMFNLLLSQRGLGFSPDSHFHLRHALKSEKAEKAELEEQNLTKRKSSGSSMTCVHVGFPWQPWSRCTRQVLESF